jgi:hypothetical protein
VFDALEPKNTHLIPKHKINATELNDETNKQTNNEAILGENDAKHTHFND